MTVNAEVDKTAGGWELLSQCWGWNRVHVLTAEYQQQIHPQPSLRWYVLPSSVWLTQHWFVITTIITYSFSCNHPHKELYFTELNVPFKKRHARYVTGATPALSDHLLRPLSPITPPLPEEGLHPLLHGPHGSLLTNGLAYSPLPSLPVGCCNTTLQFEVSSWILLLCQATVHPNTVTVSGSVHADAGLTFLLLISDQYQRLKTTHCVNCVDTK